ncbi:MAG: tRNA 2-thiouridine(34) synthase MnmA [Clostridia bacterium]|nr:tRNA 2-thiouridine(34) synthase MnmA [Clostridia bacterium]
MKILLGMSGGVDSSYAAALLKEAGYEVEGAILVMHDFTEMEKAQITADEIGIPLHIIDCKEIFREKIISQFCQEYCHGRTPNPCIRCNAEVKLRLLYETAIERGFDKIATGHYARVAKIGSRFAIQKGLDERKDQSYFLYRTDQEILEKLLLPLGELKKQEVQKRADSIALTAAKAKESQEICFIRDEKYTYYIERLYGKMPQGDFIGENGEILGKHKGILHYTVGQRKGLGIAATSRLFVKKIDPATHRVYLSSHNDTQDTFAIRDIVCSASSMEELEKSNDLTVKIRYLAKEVPVFVACKESKWVLTAKNGLHALTEGQSAVIYKGDTVMAGGIIEYLGK